VHALEAGLGELLDLDLPAMELQLLAHRAAGGQELELRDREVALLQAAHHLHTDGAGGADHGDGA
jgi:hypothetical protein